MVAQYTIFGRQVGSHILAMATLGVTFTGSYFAMRGKGQKAKEERSVPINASTKEEEDFILEFIRNANAEEEKAKAKSK
ncbi:hypothetical protein MMC07_007518 [Pseudocyphellaria aurata]|nr:hypothetical protein [Pseudocyphellaria aurata]